jgi:hypothetical protein
MSRCAVVRPVAISALALVLVARCSNPTTTTDLHVTDRPGESAMPCGDKIVMAKVASCRAAKDEASCKNAGGEWRALLTLVPSYVCACPTGQEGCSCRSFADCVEPRSCQALSTTGGPNCDGVTEFRCAAVAPWVGCYCTVMEDGSVGAWCRD